MKKTSLTLSLLLLFAGGVVSQVPDEVHEKCKDARDYVGCIQVLTGTAVSKEEVEIEEIKNLKKALALLPSRLQNTSLRDFSMAIQPFTDALAAAEAAAIGGSDYSLEDKTKILKLYTPSLRLSAAIEIYRKNWSWRIEEESSTYSGIRKYECYRYLDIWVSTFNEVFKSNVLNYMNIEDRALGSLNGRDPCELTLREFSYTGSMLAYINDASKTIQRTGSFPSYPYPLKFLEESKRAYLRNFKKFDSSVYKIRESKIPNNWTFLEEKGKKEGKPISFKKHKIWQKLAKIHEVNGRAVDLENPTQIQIIEVRELLLENAYSPLLDEGKYRRGDYQSRLCGHKTQDVMWKFKLAKYYFNSTEGSRKNNLDEAEKLALNILGSFDAYLQTYPDYCKKFGEEFKNPPKGTLKMPENIPFEGVRYRDNLSIVIALEKMLKAIEVEKE
tara:strand:+ start:112 stop:1440 length:1329 start_codon:yes stop_codon:yes gene_type:complete